MTTTATTTTDGGGLWNESMPVRVAQESERKISIDESKREKRRGVLQKKEAKRKYSSLNG